MKLSGGAASRHRKGRTIGHRRISNAASLGRAADRGESRPADRL